MIYLVATIQLAPEKVEEFSNILAKDYLPVVSKHGQKLIASWRTVIGNVDEVTDVWEFESLAHMEKVRQSLFTDPDYLKVRRKVRSLMTSESIKIVAPLPFSP